MQKFENYLAAFDGSAVWDEVFPLFDDLFHPDLTVVTADGQMNKDEWGEIAKGLTDRGAVVSGFEITGEEDEAIVYQLTIEVGDDEPIQMQARGTIRDGQLVHVAPMDPDAYSEMVERSR